MTAGPGAASRTGRWTLRARLALLLGISAAVLVVASTILFTSLSTLSTERHLVVRELDPAVLAARDLRAAMLDQETGVRGFVLTSDDEFLDPQVRGLAAATAASEQLEPVVADDERTAADFAEFQRAAEAWTAFADESMALTRGGEQSSARDEDFQAEGTALFEDVRASINMLETDLNARRDVAVEALDRAAQRVWTVAICALFGLVAVGIVIAVALKRSVTDPIIDLASDVRRIAGGDLEQAVTVEGTPELEDLAADVDAMRVQILAEIDRLNRAHAEIEQQALELQRSNADLEQFVYVASHDLQEPLRKIAGFCQLLERRYQGQLDDRADEYIAFVVDGAKRMQDLINDLLSFCRVGRTTTRFVEVPLDGAASDALDNLGQVVEDAGATIEVGDLPTVMGDRRLLVALMQNLIGNAIKFRGEEPPVVRITAVRADAAGDPVVGPGPSGVGGEPAERWIVSVADNGIGIEEEYAQQIFTIFQRLHNRAEYEGTGIGLALAKKIVEYHGGTIWLDTTVERGATFRFELPVIDETGPSTEPAEPASVADGRDHADPGVRPAATTAASDR